MTDLSELEVLVGRATELPWHLMENGFSRPVPTIYAADEELRYIARFQDGPCSSSKTPDLENARLAVAAVNALPHLISTIRSQEAALVELRAERDNAVAITKRVQSAAKTIMIGESDELARLRAEKAGEWVATKTLDSEREANAILTDERDALRSALVEAREALEPFAKIAASVLRSPRKEFADDYDWVTRQDGTKITFGHLRRAASAISKLEGGE